MRATSIEAGETNGMAFFIGLEEIPLSLGKMDWLAIKAVSPIWGNCSPDILLIFSQFNDRLQFFAAGEPAENRH